MVAGSIAGVRSAEDAGDISFLHGVDLQYKFYFISSSEIQRSSVVTPVLNCSAQVGVPIQNLLVSKYDSSRVTWKAMDLIVPRLFAQPVSGLRGDGCAGIHAIIIGQLDSTGESFDFPLVRAVCRSLQT